jgi:hydroxymethylpyrimidine/phosphomethylpyrimidine kinase
VIGAAAAPRVLLLGGLDPSGGAGITLDATVAALHGACPLPIAVTWTVQNRRGFQRADAVPTAQWREALVAVVDDGPIAAIKVGMLAAAGAVVAIAEALRPFADRVPIVIDPVLGATAGGLAANAELASAYRQQLLPLATLLTPNLPELNAIGCPTGAAALAAGAGSVLVKGGHAEGECCDDVLWQRDAVSTFSRPRLAVGRVRGTGCALGTAIACRLGAGSSLPIACRTAGDWLAAILAALPPVSAVGGADPLPRTLPLHRAPGPE